MKSSCKGIILLRPSMVQMLKCTPDPTTIASALPPMNTPETTHIFLPINDSKNPGVPEDGSHWSLLVVSIHDKVAFHYDSLPEYNLHNAAAVTSKLSVLLNIQLEFSNLEDTPQQSNTSDCGVHLCMNMRHLLVKRLLNTPLGQEVNMSLRGKGGVASSGRQEMMGIIRGLRRTAERSRSPAASRTRSDGKASPPRIA